MKHSFSLLFLSVLVMAVPAAGQRFVQETQVITPPSSLGAEYGSQVAVDGDTAVVSAWRGRFTLIYELENGVWNEVASFSSQNSPPTSPLPENGIPVISGDTIAVSYGDILGIDIYERIAGVWTYTTSVFPPVPVSFSSFGSAIDLDGDTLVAGLPRRDESFSDDVGGAYVFQRSGGVWTSQGLLVPANASGGSFAGHQVAVSGDTILLSASEDGGYSSGSSVGPGSVTVFERSGSTWNETQRLIPSFGPTLGNFGRRIAIDGDTAVASNSNRGLFIFEQVSGQWSEVASPTPVDAPATLYVYNDLDLAGETVSAGLATDATLGVGKGACYLFAKVGGTWSQQAKLFPEQDVSLFRDFGRSVAIDDDHLLVGLGSDFSYLFPRRMAFFDWRVEAYGTSCFGDGASFFPGCASCPCSNNAPAGTRGGCSNSRNRFARLGAEGSASLTGDTLQFDLVGASSSSFAILFSGLNLLPQNGSCPPGTGLPSSVFTDGLRCVGGSIVRLGTRATTAGGQTANPWGGANSAVDLLSLGGFAAGETRHFQCFYRDAGLAGCSNEQNSTNAVTVTIVP